MILPNKYVTYNKSYISIADNIINIIKTSKKRNPRIEQIWIAFSKENKNVSFTKFYYSIILLFMLDLISDQNGGIKVGHHH